MTQNEIAKQVIEYLNKRTGTKRRPIPGNFKNINARIKEGYTLEDFIYVIDVKSDEWLGTDMAKFLRPATLFQPSKFDDYLNQPKKPGITNPFDMEGLNF